MQATKAVDELLNKDAKEDWEEMKEQYDKMKLQYNGMKETEVDLRSQNEILDKKLMHEKMR